MQLIDCREAIQNAVRFPVWQFPGYSVLQELPEVLAIFAEEDWAKRMSQIASSAPLRISDLTILLIRRLLGLDLSVLKHAELDVPQAWGLAIQNYPNAVDGLCYSSRCTGNPCTVFFKRPGFAAQFQETPVSLLAGLDTADDFLDANAIALV